MSNSANAFATGRNSQNAAIAVTQGVMGFLTKEELKGVFAHELAHVKNRDILIAPLAAIRVKRLNELVTQELN